MKKIREFILHTPLTNDKYNILFIFGVQLIAYGLYGYSVKASVLLLLALAVFEYFFYYFKTSFAFNLAGMFPSVWIFTYALNRLRINSLYHIWGTKTWLVFIITPCVYLLGFVIYDWKFKKGHKIKDNLISRDYHFDHIYSVFKTVVIAGTTIAVLFAFEVAVIGYIPYFSKDMNAYVDFYVPVAHSFVVLSYFVPCIAVFYLYILNKNGKYPEYKAWHKPLVYLLSVIAIVIPILIVSRQNMFQLIFSTCFIYDSLYQKKNLKVFVLMCILLAVSYLIISPARNQSVDYLGTVYTKPGTDTGVDSGPNPLDSLPSFLKTPYIYVTISDENFSRQVRDETKFTFGLRQLELPLKVIEKITGTDYSASTGDYKATFQVNEHLNTFNLVSDFYMDFGVIGLMIEMILLGLLAAFAQDIGDQVRNPIFKIAYSMISYVFFFCYFAPWTSIFTTQFTVALIIALLVGFVYLTKPEEKS